MGWVTGMDCLWQAWWLNPDDQIKLDDLNLVSPEVPLPGKLRWEVTCPVTHLYHSGAEGTQGDVKSPEEVSYLSESILTSRFGIYKSLNILMESKWKNAHLSKKNSPFWAVSAWWAVLINFWFFFSYILWSVRGPIKKKSEKVGHFAQPADPPFPPPCKLGHQKKKKKTF